MPFERVWTSYNLVTFEDERQHNEGRFTAAIISYMLINMFRSSEAAPVDFEKHCTETIGMIPSKKKLKINKESEVDKSNKTMEMILNGDWGV